MKLNGDNSSQLVPPTHLEWTSPRRVTRNIKKDLWHPLEKAISHFVRRWGWRRLTGNPGIAGDFCRVCLQATLPYKPHAADLQCLSPSEAHCLNQRAACINERFFVYFFFSPLLEASFRFLLVRFQRVFGLDLRILLLLF